MHSIQNTFMLESCNNKTYSILAGRIIRIERLERKTNKHDRCRGKEDCRTASKFYNLI